VLEGVEHGVPVDFLQQCPVFTVATAPGKTHKHVAANVTHVYPCSFLPFGNVWGQSGITYYYNSLPLAVRSFAKAVKNAWQWNITIRGRAPGRVRPWQ